MFFQNFYGYEELNYTYEAEARVIIYHAYIVFHTVYDELNHNFIALHTRKPESLSTMVSSFPRKNSTIPFQEKSVPLEFQKTLLD